MQFGFGEKIDLHAERILEVLLQSNEIEERRPLAHIDKEVDIAAFLVSPFRHGTEHAQIARAVSGGDGEQLVPMSGECFGGFHGRYSRRFWRACASGRRNG